MSLKAYQQAQVKTEDPRATEYRLFGQVTGALLNAKESNAIGTPLVEAIDWQESGWQQGVVSSAGAVCAKAGWASATSAVDDKSPRILNEPAIHPSTCGRCRFDESSGASLQNVYSVCK